MDILSAYIGIITKSTYIYIQSKYTYIQSKYTYTHTHSTGNMTLLASSVHGAPAARPTTSQVDIKV